MKKEINGILYTKTSFGAKWTELTNRPIGSRLIKEDQKFVECVISNYGPWKKILNRGNGYYFKIINKKFQGRAVRGIALVTPNTSKEVWIGKQKVLDLMFPKNKVSYSEMSIGDAENKKRVLAALRQIIEPQISKYRTAARRQIKGVGRYKLRCALTGESLDHGEFHVDHKYPFKKIVEDWCREIDKDLSDIPVICHGTKCRLKSKDLAENFFDYHLINANLQITTAKANLKKGSKY